MYFLLGSRRKAEESDSSSPDPRSKVWKESAGISEHWWSLNAALLHQFRGGTEQTRSSMPHLGACGSTAKEANIQSVA